MSTHKHTTHTTHTNIIMGAETSNLSNALAQETCQELPAQQAQQMGWTKDQCISVMSKSIYSAAENGTHDNIKDIMREAMEKAAEQQKKTNHAHHTAK